MPSVTFQYRPGFYIDVSDLSGKEIIVATYSPSGYGGEWRKECKSVHAAKLAITAYAKRRVVELWNGADDFTKAYIEAALWSSNDESDESGGNPMDSNYDQFDIALPALESIIEECAEFQRDNAETLAQAYEQYIPRDGFKGAALAGHDFWLTRNHHGVGFWDRKELEENDIGQKLTDASDATGERHLYIGDDGKVYQE